MLDTAVVCFVIFLVFVYAFYRHVSSFGYWKERNVLHIPPVPIFGNYKQFFIDQLGIGVLVDSYNRFPNEKYYGQYRGTQPELIVRDPDLIKQVLIKDFNHFTDRLRGMDLEVDILTQNLFQLEGDKWKDVRQKLTPTFTSSKLKNMFYLIVERVDDFKKYVEIAHKDSEDIECAELVAKFTTDIIGSVGFGVSMNSMLDHDAPFRKFGREIFQMNFMKIAKTLFLVRFPDAFKFLRLTVYNNDSIQFFFNTIKDIVRQRENTNTKRHDFVDLLLELKQKNNSDSKHSQNTDNVVIDDKFITAQAFIFFSAGFETTSTLSGFVLHELAYNPDIQEKVYEEVTNVLKECNGKLSYDSMSKMTYLEMVIMEGMRKYPALGYLPRFCNAQYTFPGTDLTIEKGTPIMIPIYPIHYDPKYYPEPEKFIPERFTPEAQHERHAMVYLPFGEGPRHCLGKRLGIMQAMVVLASLLCDYTVIPSLKSKRKVEMNPFSFVMRSKNGVWLNLVKRNA